MKRIHGIFIIVIALFLRSIQSVLTQIVAYIDQLSSSSFDEVNHYFLFENNIIFMILILIGIFVMLKSKEW